MVRHARSPFVLLAAVVLLGAQARAQTYLGPKPYLSSADSPLLLTKPELEDMEDGSFDLAGVTYNHGAIYGPASNCDSVDADDGVIDGSGANGHSFFYSGGSTGITFTFDDAVIGSFPTSAGLVWTDGGAGAPVTFEAFDASGASLGTFGPFSIADNTNYGTTAEDRFFGIASRNGISAIKASNTSGGIEVDHVQYSVGALSLEASDTSFSANDPITLTLAGGKAYQLGMFVALGLNGTPLWLPILLTTFDAAGEIALSSTVPSGLSGLVVDLGGVGIAPSGKVRFSDVVALTFN